MMMAEAGGRGAWARLFSEPNMAKFHEPTLEGVDFPTLGVARAWNDPAAGVLTVGTYAADSARRGHATSFRLTRIPTDLVQVRCDDAEHHRWRVSGAGEITVDTDIGLHRFAIVVPPWGRDRLPEVQTPESRSATELSTVPTGPAVPTESVGRTLGSSPLAMTCACCG